MELELGLAPPNPHFPPPGGGCGGEFVGVVDAAPAGACGKRVFGEAFRADKATLPLFVSHGDGSDGDDGSRDGLDRDTSNKRKRLVGWPPVKCAHYRRSCGGGCGGYVKVKMEGVAIGRKVDVSLHASYEELLRTLARMFPPSADTGGAGAEAAPPPPATQQQERGRGHPYVVTYEDGDGDWLLVGDVPWDAFAKSVKRLKILAS